MARSISSRVCPAVRDGRALRVVLDQVQDDRIGHEAGFDDLGQPGNVVGPGHGLQRGQVGQHPGRGPERPDQVLALGDVDRRLASDRRVDHAQQRGRDQHDADPAQPGGRHEAGQVGHGAAADADHAVGAADPLCGQPGPEPGRNADLLGRLPVRYFPGDHLVARVLERAAGRARDVRDAGGVDDEDGGGFLAHQAGQLAEDAGADHGLVGTLTGDAGPDGDVGDAHLLPSQVAMSSAISSGARSSAGTVKEASRS